MSQRASIDLERALELIRAQIADRDIDDSKRLNWIGLESLVVDSVTNMQSRIDDRALVIDQIENLIMDCRFSVVYQPIIDLSSGMEIGFEALSRFGESNPSRWFTDAESVGLRVALELFAIGEALHSGAAKMIPQAGFLSVNASPSALMSPRFAAAFEGADLNRLVVELTEDTPIEDPDSVRAVLQPLREKGLRLAVDDTGGGYASLKVILQLKPELIKFDRFFVNDLEHDPARRALFSASVDFANATGAMVVAEGVETAEQLLILQQLGVHLAQGFFLGRPSALM